jgi:nucleoside-diphosphate-sugar epimerase
VSNRVLVTGGSGFLGTNVVEALIRQDSSVASLDRVPPRCSAHRRLWIPVDVRDALALRRAVEQFQPTTVFHLAARTDLLGDNSADYDANTIGVKNLIDAISATKCVERVIFASTMLVCRLGYIPRSDTDFAPNTAYGESKVAGERIVRALGKASFAWAIVRPTSLWGPWFASPYRDFFEAVRRRWYLHPGQQRVFRSYGFVGNSTFQLLKLAGAQSDCIDGKTFYLADYEPIELGKWADEIAHEMALGRPRRAPLALLRLMAKIGDGLKRLGYQNPPLTTFRLNNMTTSAVYDLSALRTICGDLPYDMHSGIRETIAWMHDHRS